MKCIKNIETGEITRETDERADKLTKNKDKFWFAPKSEWREQLKVVQDEIDAARAQHEASKKKNKQVKASGK